MEAIRAIDRPSAIVRLNSSNALHCYTKIHVTMTFWINGIRVYKDIDLLMYLYNIICYCIIVSIRLYVQSNLLYSAQSNDIYLCDGTVSLWDNLRNG